MGRGRGRKRRAVASSQISTQGHGWPSLPCRPVHSAPPCQGLCCVAQRPPENTRNRCTAYRDCLPYLCTAYCLPGSDLVYCSESPRPLAALVRELLLRNPGAAALIAHRHRNPELDDNMEREFAAQVGG